MNRRFFGKKFAVGVITAGVSGALGMSPKDAGSSDTPSNILQLDFEDGEYLMFRADKILDYEIEKTGEFYDWGCRYTVLMDDGSRVRRLSSKTLVIACDQNRVLMAVDIAPIGCVAL